MEFFDKLGQKASEAYKVTADKTGKLAKETKLKFKINELKCQISDIYEDIGKTIYEHHIREENIDIKNQIEEKCTKIDVLSDEIEALLQECLELKNKKQCPKCQTQIDINVKFCPQCGEPQTSEPSEEERLEKLENTEVKSEKEDQKQIIEENLKEKINNSNSDEKSNNEDEETTDQDEDIEQKEEDIEDQEDNEEEKDHLQQTVEIESNVNLEDEEDE